MGSQHTRLIVTVLWVDDVITTWYLSDRSPWLPAVVNRRYFQNLFIHYSYYYYYYYYYHYYYYYYYYYLFVNVNCNFTHQALRTRFNVSVRSRFTFYLDFGNVFFFKGKRITGAPGENISENGRENLNHISRPLRDLEHFKRGKCSNHWAHPRGEG